MRLDLDELWLNLSVLTVNNLLLFQFLLYLILLLDVLLARILTAAFIIITVSFLIRLLINHAALESHVQFIYLRLMLDLLGTEPVTEGLLFMLHSLA